MNRTWRRFGVAAVVASSVSFAQTTLPAAPPSGAPAAAAQPDAMSKLSSSVNKAYSEIDKAKGALSSNTPDGKTSASSHLGNAEQEFDTAKSALPAGTQKSVSGVLDTAKSKVTSAKSMLNDGKVQEAQKLLGQVPPLASVQQSVTKGLSSVPGMGGSGPSIPGTGTPSK